ncbi:hypothetical protein RIF29_37886 [Crotalaria pallida]|uniref:RNase H type-1 domain-containing protein n=1 Tax=Crotalaria pallida TaxID=3830 RepID=A0AAN9E050_CROPI
MAPTEEPALAGGGEAQLGDNNGNPRIVDKDPVKVADKATIVPDIVELDYGDWLVVTRRKRSPPKNPQAPHNNDKVLGGHSKNLSGPTTKSGPEFVAGPSVKTHAIKVDSGKSRRQDRSTPTHVLLKNAGKDVYVLDQQWILDDIRTTLPQHATNAILQGQNFATISDPVEWFKLGESHNSPLFFATLWWIWKARNAMCIERRKIPRHSVINSIHNLSSLIKSNLSNTVSTPSPQKWIKWENPPSGSIAVNVDGSCKGNPGPAGFGGLLRDDSGKWLTGFYGHVGISNNLHVEIEAILRGLEVAWNYGARKVVCFSDSLDALRLVENNLGIFHLYASILRVIYAYKLRPWELSFKHILHEGNTCADILAKSGASCSALMTILNAPPAALGSSLLAVAMGVSLPRP